ncbi:MAG: DUF4407 domain-containing protein [Bacteroidetes bacterium]|nr:DUF4407 domain-containing protein [Bacteroidota bacterium]
MKDLWLKLGCFLSGYNYFLLKNSSEASAKAVRKLLSALLIISILWGFIGFTFASRYLHVGTMGAAIISLVMIIIVIQIERQIILTTRKNKLAGLFRVIIAIVMAIVGSVIIDQILFKDDIETERISSIQEKVNTTLPFKTWQIDREIHELDSMINVKEAERMQLSVELSRNPFVKGTTSERKNHIIKVTDKNGNPKDSVITRVDVTLADVTNPKGAQMAPLEKHISDLMTQKADKQAKRLTIRDDIENDYKSKVGFLDELDSLMAILGKSYIALFVWLLVFIFFFALEMFVLVNKSTTNDYEATINHQMDVKIKMIDELASQFQKNVKG